MLFRVKIIGAFLLAVVSFSPASKAADERALVLWHADLRANSVMDSLEAAGFKVRAQIIWDKKRLVIGRGDYHFQHEPCWYAVKTGKTGHWAGDRKQTTVWAIDKPMKSETGHSTQKPVECMQRPIENNSSPGQGSRENGIRSRTLARMSRLSACGSRSERRALMLARHGQQCFRPAVHAVFNPRAVPVARHSAICLPTASAT